MKFIRSIQHAWRGLREVFWGERNFRIEVLIGFAVAIASLIFPLTHTEKLLIILVISSVLVLELLNSALERVIDTLKPRIDLFAGVAKDILAAAVFLMSIAAALIGIIIFYPYLVK